MNGGAHPDGSLQKSFPELVGAGDPPPEGHRCHIHVAEAGAEEQACERVLVGEAEEIRPGRDGGRGRRAGLRKGVDEKPEQPRTLGPVPDAERYPPAGREHATQLGRGALGSADVEDREVRHRCVERAVREREPLGVAVGE